MSDNLSYKDRNLLEAAAYFIMMSAAEIGDDIVDEVERGEFYNISSKNSESDNWLVAEVYAALAKAHTEKDESKFTSYIKDIYSYSPSEFFQIVSRTADNVADPAIVIGLKQAMIESARIMMLAADGLVDDAEQMYLEYLESVFGNLESQ